MSNIEPRRPDFRVRSSDVPEDVRAELDAEERRLQPEPLGSGPADEVPEDVIAEMDLEAKLVTEEVRQRLSEGRPPVEGEPRS